MLRLIKIFVCYCLFIGTVWGHGDSYVQYVINNHDALMEMDLANKEKLISHLAAPEHTYDAKAKILVVKSFVEYLKCLVAYNTTSPKFNQYSEFGALIGLFYQERAEDRLGEIYGTVFEKALMELPEIIKNMPDKVEFTYLNTNPNPTTKWLTMVLDGEQIKTQFDREMINISGEVNTEIFFKNAETFFNKKEVEKREFLAAKRAIYLYSSDGEVLYPVESVELVKLFIGKVLADLGSDVELQQRAKAFEMLWSKEAELLLNNVAPHSRFVVESIRGFKNIYNKGAVDQVLLDDKLKKMKVELEDFSKSIY